MEPLAHPVADGHEVHAPGEAARLLLGGAFLTYYILTVALFFGGPWEYPVTDGRGTFIAFLAAVHVAFAVGYFTGTRGTPRPGRVSLAIGSVVLVAATVDFLLTFPTSLVNTGTWVPHPFRAIEDLAAAYTGSLSLRDAGRPYVNYVRIFVAPVIGLAAPLGVFYWRRLGWPTRLMVVASVVATIALFVAMGANAGAGHWMALFPWFVLSAHLAGENRLGPRGWAAAVAVQVLSVVLFVVLFTATMNQRSGSFAKFGAIPGIGAELSAGDVDGGPMASAPRSAARVGADGLAGYFTQGYFAVYLSLKEPFVPNFGVGNSMFLQRQVARVVGPDFLDRPYPARIQRAGWNAYGYWATIYPWIASDVTFPGTVIVMFAIGWLAGRVWLDVLGGQNAFAVAFFGQLLILLYYVPAHNKVMHSGEGVVGFWVLLAAWAFARRRHGT